VLPAEVVDADSVDRAASVIGKETALEVFALDAGEATAICAVPTAAMSVPGIVALSWAAFVCVGAT
jgi:hypothetical protein